jgi:hypothetical protein
LVVTKKIKNPAIAGFNCMIYFEVDFVVKISV